MKYLLFAVFVMAWSSAEACVDTMRGNGRQELVNNCPYPVVVRYKYCEDGNNRWNETGAIASRRSRAIAADNGRCINILYCRGTSWNCSR